MQKLTVLVTGASGFIGSHLLAYLLERQYKVIALTRQRNKSSDHPDLYWVNHFEQIETTQIDYVVNLAGENIGAKRWTESRKQQLIESRVAMTQKLYEWLDVHQILLYLCLNFAKNGSKWRSNSLHKTPKSFVWGLCLVMVEFCRKCYCPFV